MQLKLIPLQQALSKAYLKSSIQQNQIDLFAEQLNNLFSRHNKAESEENHKNIISDFLKNSLYKLLKIGMERFSQTGDANIREKRGNKWFEKRYNIAYFDEFTKLKIIYPNMTKYLPFVLDDEGYYTNQKCFIMTGETLYYLDSFLNSNLFKFCFRDNFPELLGRTRELSKVFFEKIPVKPITEEAELPSKTIVEQAMTFKKADPSADISTLDAELNKMIYEYYRITPEEQIVIEETVKGWMG